MGKSSKGGVFNMATYRRSLVTPPVLRLLPDGSLLEPGGTLSHLGICGATQLSPREGTEQVVQFGLEMLQDQPDAAWVNGKLMEIGGKWMKVVFCFEHLRLKTNFDGVYLLTTKNEGVLWGWNVPQNRMDSSEIFVYTVYT
jgi:hypothetical protein